jgi:hypothetical protein
MAWKAAKGAGVANRELEADFGGRRLMQAGKAASSRRTPKKGSTKKA